MQQQLERVERIAVFTEVTKLFACDVIAVLIRRFPFTLNLKLKQTKRVFHNSSLLWKSLFTTKLIIGLRKVFGKVT